MNAIFYRLLMAFVFGSLALGRLSADPVEVRDLKYSLARYKSSEPWYKLSIELEAFRETSNELRRDPDYVDDLRVELTVGFDVEQENRELPFEFYRAVTELVSMEVGQGIVRFYLPPEIVSRDRLRGEPHSYLIRLSRNGEQIHQSVSRSLSRESVLQNFETRVSEFAPSNDGVLIRQQDTPFVAEYSDATLHSKVEFPSQ